MEKINNKGIPRLENERWFINKIKELEEKKALIIQMTRCEKINRPGAQSYQEIDELVFNFDKKNIAAPALYLAAESSKIITSRQSAAKNPAYIKPKGLFQKSGKLSIPSQGLPPIMTPASVWPPVYTYGAITNFKFDSLVYKGKNPRSNMILALSATSIRGQTLNVPAKLSGTKLTPRAGVIAGVISRNSRQL